MPTNTSVMLKALRRTESCFQGFLSGKECQVKRQDQIGTFFGIAADNSAAVVPAWLQYVAAGSSQ